jgi:acyl-CoA dehydrogenase
MTEPGTGSDVAGVRTTAVLDGDEYVLNGAKTFITGARNAELVIVLARTSQDPDNRRNGLTLLVVEEGMPGRNASPSRSARSPSPGRPSP